MWIDTFSTFTMETWPSVILNANSVVSFSCYAKKPWLAAVWVVCAALASGVQNHWKGCVEELNCLN